jgi:hypothetical protein
VPVVTRKEGGDDLRSVRRWLPDWFDASLMVALVLLSLMVAGYEVWQAHVHHLVWTGGDGLIPMDDLQYLSWIRDVSKHFLASDLFVLRATHHDYIEPLVGVAGGLTALGIAPKYALLLLTPPVVVALFFSVRAYSATLFAGLWERRIVLLLAFFFGSFGLVQDNWLPFLTWGYLPAVGAIAAVPAALVSYDYARRNDRLLWLPALFGFLASWLHPWQGEELLLLLIGAEALVRWRPSVLAGPATAREAWESRRFDALTLPLLTVAGTLLPLVYYLALDRLDPIWALGSQAAALHRPLPAILLGFVPLLIVAGFAYRVKPTSFTQLATMIWPAAALVVYLLCQAGLGSTSLHAFGGLTIPLAALAVIGWRNISAQAWRHDRRLIVLLVVAVTVPASIVQVARVPGIVGVSIHHLDFISLGDQRAIQYLADDPQPGGVLAPYNVGAVVPSETDRRSYDGDLFWSVPDEPERNRLATRLFSGLLSKPQALAFVRHSGAHFLLSPCNLRADMWHVVGRLIHNDVRFGCATVYVLGGRSKTK